MMDEIQRLYPAPAEEVPLRGVYLKHDLLNMAVDSNRPFVYANFIVSLDGRIAVPRPNQRGLTVPKATTNERDWRLFQELTSQADVVLSSGRYLREWAEGRAQEILQIEDPRFADLREWRRERGLPLYPDIAIISRSLDFPIPPVLQAGGRRALVFTVEQVNPENLKRIEANVDRVERVGEQDVDGALLIQQLARSGYRTIYSAAGPQVLHLLLAGRVLDRLYLTHAHKTLGGKPFSAILEGSLLDPPASFQLYQLYFDPHALEGAGQLFTSYNRIED